MNLLQFLAVPLVTCLLIAGTPRAVYNRMFALVGTAVQLFLVIYLIRQFITARIQQPAEIYFLQQFIKKLKLISKINLKIQKKILE